MKQKGERSGMERQMSAFKVGSRVTIHTGQNGPQSLARVERFTHDGRCMILSDGSAWRADGKRQWSFRGSFYKGPVVEPAQESDAEHIAKRRAIGAIRKWAEGLTLDTPLTADALRRVLELIQQPGTDPAPDAEPPQP